MNTRPGLCCLLIVLIIQDLPVWVPPLSRSPHAPSPSQPSLSFVPSHFSFPLSGRKLCITFFWPFFFAFSAVSYLFLFFHLSFSQCVGPFVLILVGIWWSTFLLIRISLIVFRYHHKSPSFWTHIRVIITKHIINPKTGSFTRSRLRKNNRSAKGQHSQWLQCRWHFVSWPACLAPATSSVKMKSAVRLRQLVR